MDVQHDDRGKFFTPRINKESVLSLIHTTSQTIVGNVYVRPEYRLKDEVSEGDERFLAITEASVYTSDGSELRFCSEFLLVAYAHIVAISPYDTLSQLPLAPWTEHLQASQ